MTRARLDRVTAKLTADLYAQFEKRKDALYQTSDMECVKAWVEASNWLAGYSHEDRPKPAVWAKAFRFRESIPHELIELQRKLFTVNGSEALDQAVTDAERAKARRARRKPAAKGKT